MTGTDQKIIKGEAEDKLKSITKFRGLQYLDF